MATPNMRRLAMVLLACFIQQPVPWRRTGDLSSLASGAMHPSQRKARSARGGHPVASIG